MEGCSVLPDTGSDAGPLRLPEVLPPRIRRVPRRAQAQEPSELSQLEVPQTEVHTSDKEVATPSRSKGCAKVRSLPLLLPSDDIDDTHQSNSVHLSLWLFMPWQLLLCSRIS